MQFKDIKGQEEIKRRLVKTVDANRVSHAQMFTGEAGSGTLPLALAYIQYLNCPNRADGDSCGECPSCQKIANLQHPDLHFVMPVNKQGKKSGEAITSDTFLPEWRKMVTATGGYFDEQMWYDTLGLENLQGLISKREADEVIRKLSFKSFEGGYKAVVVWLPERMNIEAANTLLKILEEPWDRTLFILVSAKPELLLPTILSRVQQTVVPGSEFDARRALAGVDAEEGSEEFELFVELMRLSYNDKHLELMKWAERAAALGRERQKRLLENFIRLTRASFMLNAGLEDIAYLWGAELDFCRRFAPFIGPRNVEPLVSEIESALGQLRQNGSAAIVFTHFALAASKMIIK
ncbi:MAG: DNA polymerase III subunit delta [Alistipes sp.]|jgi:DNA polymerase-3 subunit delta'|nr:DNA polymerase III subunit delta [Alistipes sp.]